MCGLGYSYIKVYIGAAGYKNIYTTYKIIYKRNTRTPHNLLSLPESFTLPLRFLVQRAESIIGEMIRLG